METPPSSQIVKFAQTTQSMKDKVWQSIGLVADWTKELAHRLSPKQIALLIIASLASIFCLLGWSSLSSLLPLLDTSGDPIFGELHQQNQLVTATYTTQEFVETSAKNLLGETKILYLAIGNITAGIDFSKIEVKPSKWGFFTKAAQVVLPAPQVFDVQIDVGRSRIYDIRKQTWVSPGNAAELLEQAQQLAKAKIRKKACQSNLLQYANDRSQVLVSQILHKAGYKNLSVRSQLNADTCLSHNASETGRINPDLPPVTISTVL